MNAITGRTAFATETTGTAEILARETPGYAVLAEGQRALARRAVSCLVEPEPGDLVLLATAGAQRFVLAVLERPGEAPVRVALPDGAVIAAEGGRLGIAVGTLAIEAEATHLAAGSLAVSASRTEARLGRIRLIAEAIESMAERIIGRFRRSYRFVEEGEHLRARDIDHRASGHLHLRGDTTAVQANALVKLQSGQIHLG